MATLHRQMLDLLEAGPLIEMFQCQECGKKYKTPPPDGTCKKCGGSDIDLAESSCTDPKQCSCKKCKTSEKTEASVMRTAFDDPTPPWADGPEPSKEHHVGVAIKGVQSWAQAMTAENAEEKLSGLIRAVSGLARELGFGETAQMLSKTINKAKMGL